MEAVFYPPHSPRTESTAYGAIHHHLVHKEDRPCVVCGVKYSTLKSPTRNRFGAVQLETHHALIEWSLAKAIDVGKFNADVISKLREQNPLEPLYRRTFSRSEMEAWIDHHPDNLWVLCDVHHRHRGVGIHAISGPIWGAQVLLMDRYELGSQDALKAMRTMIGTK
ncbi:MAG: hypothetical protein JST54_12100 [Deltaproteobacteria bacterium]|nr:hypothetical protein [Deltaproteobacteria bacterium]